jgi:hypothetical protein
MSDDVPDRPDWDDFTDAWGRVYADALADWHGCRQTNDSGVLLPPCRSCRDRAEVVAEAHATALGLSRD